jgi:hypothetical protein
MWNVEVLVCAFHEKLHELPERFINTNEILIDFNRTFVSNMKAFGLDRDKCSEFLHKMSTIGELDEGICMTL